MPLGDKTGPLGQGPMTGRAAGFCAGYGQPGYANPVGGRGFGMGRGRGFGFGRGMGFGFGRGCRNRFFAAGAPGWCATGDVAATEAAPGPGEKQVLTNQAETLQAQLDAIHKRLEQMGKA